MYTDTEQREALLAAILKTAVDAIITIDERGIIESANPATESLFGYAIEELLGQNVSILMPAPYSEEHDEYLRSYVATGKAKIIGIGREVTGKRRDGTTFPMDLAVSEVCVGDHRFFTGVVRDISDRKRAEEEQASVGRIIEQSLNEIFIFDAVTLRFLQVNRGARQNLGYTMEELSDLTPLDIKPDYNAEGFGKHIDPLKRGDKQSEVFYTRHRRKDGTHYDAEVHLQMSQFRGKPCFVAIILDITERKKAEQALASLNEELEQRVEDRTRALKEMQAQLILQEKMATLGQVSGGIAHEIKNPLNAIRTSAYFLLHALDPPREKVQEHLERIDRQVNLADNVITALSKFAKLPTPDKRSVALEACLAESLSTISIPKNIEVAVQVPPDTPEVFVDPDQMMIVFRNLIRNARDAMPEGGKLTLSAKPNGDFVDIVTKDTGSGIAPEFLDRILEPLYSTKARGMGLGLAISSAIVERHEGKLTVDSEVGVGSEFVVQLATSENGGPS